MKTLKYYANKIVIILMLVATIGVIHLDKYIINYSVEQLEEDLSELSWDNHPHRVDILIENIFHKIGDLQYIKKIETESTIIYEVAYTEVTKETFSEYEDKFETYTKCLSKNLYKVWFNTGLDKLVEVDLLSNEDRDVVLLTAVGGEITFNSKEFRDHEPTDEDWIQYFEYLYGFKPSSSALKQFKKDKMYQKEE